MIKRKWIFTWLVIILWACGNNNPKQAAIEKIVREWVGKEIQFPNDVACAVAGKEVNQCLCDSLYAADFKILLLVDSTGCSECRLQLPMWQELINETDTLFNNKISFLFFLQPKNKEDILWLFKKEKFYYPVFFDEKNLLNKINGFNFEKEHQCFLLDKSNNILLIGNPVTSIGMWELIKSTIKENYSISTPLKKVNTKRIKASHTQGGTLALPLYHNNF